MEVSRKEKGNMALMVIEVDQNVDDTYFTRNMRILPNITQVTRITD